MKFVYYKKNKQRQIYRNSVTLSPYTTLYPHMRMCNADNKKMSLKGFNVKEDDRALPL